MPARPIADAIGHSRQASRLREQLEGLLPGAEAVAADAKAEAGDGLRRLLDYAQLLSEYWQPAVALVRRLSGRPLAEPPPPPPPPPRGRRFGWRSVLVAGVVAGIGLIAFEVARTTRRSRRNA